MLDSVALITGAGSGIGASIAAAFCKEGRRVAIVGRRADALARVAKNLRSAGGDVLEIAADITAEGAPNAIVTTVVDAYGQLDVLVNNAAVTKLGALDSVSVEALDRQVAVNMRAPFLMSQAALPLLRQSSRNPSILNISSSAGVVVRPNESVYGMTKAALNYLTKSLAGELAPDGIRVNAIVPGPVDTPIHASYSTTSGAAELDRLLPQIPLGRVGRPSEIATWASFLCGSDAEWLTGVVLPVDGGQTLDFR